VGTLKGIELIGKLLTVHSEYFYVNRTLRDDFSMFIGSTDPARYIGDMLAWIHQSLPGEKENLLTLLKYCDKFGKFFMVEILNQRCEFSINYNIFTDLDEKVSGCLSNIMDGVSRPLNVRMEQAVLSGLDCTVMNKIDICMQFYVETMEQVNLYSKTRNA